MRGRINGIEGGKILASFVKIAIAAAIMSAVSWFTYFFLHQTFGAANLIFKLIEVLIPIALGGICFIVVAKLLRVTELESAYNAFARKFGRKK